MYVVTLNFFSVILICLCSAKHLLNQFEKFVDEFIQTEEDFVKLSGRFQPELIQKWQDMETRPFIGRDGKPRSLFQVDSAQGKYLNFVI